MHYGNSSTPLPIFSIDKPPMDSSSALNNTLYCPVKFISKAPPTMVVDNLSFIVDGDQVSPDEILSDTRWWKQTSASTRFYVSDTLRVFHPVTMLICRGEMRGAYRSRQQRGGGVHSVPMETVYKVARHFGYWHSCHAFHRIVSVISPVTVEGQMQCGFKQRIFVQYFWRNQKDTDRARVQKEYDDSKGKLSATPLSIEPKARYNGTRNNSREDILSSHSSTPDSTPISPPLRHHSQPRRPHLPHLPPLRDRAMSLTPNAKSLSKPRLSIDGSTMKRKFQ